MPLPLSDDQVIERLSTLGGWTLSPDKSSIQKEWQFDTFKTAVRFFVAVGELAEELDHHPNFLSSYRTVKIELSTHDLNRLTDLDFELAMEIEQIVHGKFLNLVDI